MGNCHAVSTKWLLALWFSRKNKRTTTTFKEVKQLFSTFCKTVGIEESTKQLVDTFVEANKDSRFHLYNALSFDRNYTTYTELYNFYTEKLKGVSVDLHDFLLLVSKYYNERLRIQRNKAKKAPPQVLLSESVLQLEISDCAEAVEYVNNSNNNNSNNNNNNGNSNKNDDQNNMTVPFSCIYRSSPSFGDEILAPWLLVYEGNVVEIEVGKDVDLQFSGSSDKQSHIYLIFHHSVTTLDITEELLKCATAFSSRTLIAQAYELNVKQKDGVSTKTDSHSQAHSLIKPAEIEILVRNSTIKWVKRLILKDYKLLFEGQTFPSNRFRLPKDCIIDFTVEELDLLADMISLHTTQVKLPDSGAELYNMVLAIGEITTLENAQFFACSLAANFKFPYHEQNYAVSKKSWFILNFNLAIDKQAQHYTYLNLTTFVDKFAKRFHLYFTQFPIEKESSSEISREVTRRSKHVAYELKESSLFRSFFIGYCKEQAANNSSFIFAKDNIQKFTIGFSHIIAALLELDLLSSLVQLEKELCFQMFVRVLELITTFKDSFEFSNSYFALWNICRTLVKSSLLTPAQIQCYLLENNYIKADLDNNDEATYYSTLLNDELAIKNVACSFNTYYRVESPLFADISNFTCNTILLEFNAAEKEELPETVVLALCDSAHVYNSKLHNLLTNDLTSRSKFQRDLYNLSNDDIINGMSFHDDRTIMQQLASLLASEEKQLLVVLILCINNCVGSGKTKEGELISDSVASNKFPNELYLMIFKFFLRSKPVFSVPTKHKGVVVNTFAHGIDIVAIVNNGKSVDSVAGDGSRNDPLQFKPTRPTASRKAFYLFSTSNSSISLNVCMLLAKNESYHAYSHPSFIVNTRF